MIPSRFQNYLTLMIDSDETLNHNCISSIMIGLGDSESVTVLVAVLPPSRMIPAGPTGAGHWQKVARGLGPPVTITVSP